MLTKPLIFDYHNFRTYLSDSYEYRHQIDAGFSKAYICKMLGLPNTRSYFGDILAGKVVTQIKVPLFIKLFDLDKDEALFFRSLVNYNQADDPDERELLFEQLISLNRTPKKIITSLEYAYYKEFRHSVIRATLNIFDFCISDGFMKLAKYIVPAITEKEAKTSVELLLKLGLIAENELGFLKPTDKAITTGPYAHNEIIKNFQAKSLDMAKKVLLSNDPQPQRAITKMISISEEGYKRLEKQINKFNSEITSLIHKDEKAADRVYQLALVLYPQSQIKK